MRYGMYATRGDEIVGCGPRFIVCGTLMIGYLIDYIVKCGCVMYAYSLMYRTMVRPAIFAFDREVAQPLYRGIT